MKPTREYVIRKFNEYNDKMFGGKLPAIPVMLSDAATFMGMIVSQVRTRADGTKEHHSFEMRINARVDLPQDVVDDTIIHEMIHYFIHYNGLTDTSVHGHIFKAIMHSINTAYGRHITIRHKTTAEEHEQFINPKAVWHVIAVLRFTSGKCGVKVLPRVIPKVVDFYRQCLRIPEVDRVELYLHNNPYFNRYPTSTSFRIYDIDNATLTENLKNSHPLEVEGNKVVEKYRRK